MNKRQILFIHSGGPQGLWLGSGQLLNFLKEEVGNEFEFINPEMPSPEFPQYKCWEPILKETIDKARDGVLLIGHSLGGSVLLKYLSENPCQINIEGLFLVAAPFWGAKDWKVEEFQLKDEFANNLPYIPHIHIYHSHEDAVVPFHHALNYANHLPNVELKRYEDRGHFFEDGILELVEDLLLVP